MTGSTALLTDHYELTMLQAALAGGTAHRRSVFELFPRRLPEGRRYGVVAGVGRALDALERFRFGPEEIGFLREAEVVDEDTLAWLADYRFSGDVWGYPEGEVYFPQSPLMVVESTFAEAVLLETVLLSILNHDSAIASAASRMTCAAGGRPCIEMGSRRTHEEAAVAAARAAYLSGFATSSNLAARQRYGVPTAGTGRPIDRLAGVAGREDSSYRALTANTAEILLYSPTPAVFTDLPGRRRDRYPAVSGWISIFAPVSLAARRAFWPSLPMASDSW